MLLEEEIMTIKSTVVRAQIKISLQLRKINAPSNKYQWLSRSFFYVYMQKHFYVYTFIYGRNSLEIKETKVSVKDVSVRPGRWIWTSRKQYEYVRNTLLNMCLV